MTEEKYEKIISEELKVFEANNVLKCALCFTKINEKNKSKFCRCKFCAPTKDNFYCSQSNCISIVNLRHNNLNHKFKKEKIKSMDPNKMALDPRQLEIQALNNSRAIEKTIKQENNNGLSVRAGLSGLGGQGSALAVILAEKVGINPAWANIIANFGIDIGDKLPHFGVSVLQFTVALGELCYLGMKVHSGDISNKEAGRKLLSIAINHSVVLASGAICLSVLGPWGVLLSTAVSYIANRIIDTELLGKYWRTDNKSEAKMIKKAFDKFNVSKESIKTINESEINRRYKERARECHPDRGGTRDQFIELSMSYSVLNGLLKLREQDSQKFNQAVNFACALKINEYFSLIF